MFESDGAKKFCNLILEMDSKSGKKLRSEVDSM